ncbi:hypothetical protein COU61_00075, partial [Candidatus Pacearchaeota archaeon CG10_big_fil_rev_8_21_14_0_10_35_13]
MTEEKIKKQTEEEKKEKNEEVAKEEKATEKTEEKKTEEKKKEEPRVKKEEAHVNIRGLPVSKKHSMAICKHIKGMSLERAIEELEKVMTKSKPLPMRGEIPHRKGRIMSGRYPMNASKEMIKVLKSLIGNSNVNGIEDPVIVIASASHSSRSLRRGGSKKLKRTNVHIEVKERKKKNKNQEKKK